MSNLENDISDNMMEHLDDKIKMFESLSASSISASSIKFVAKEFTNLKNEFVDIIFSTTHKRAKK